MLELADDAISKDPSLLPDMPAILQDAALLLSRNFQRDAICEFDTLTDQEFEIWLEGPIRRDFHQALAVCHRKRQSAVDLQPSTPDRDHTTQITILTVINEFSDAERLALLLFYRGHSVSDISSIMTLNDQAVYQVIARGLFALDVLISHELQTL